MQKPILAVFNTQPPHLYYGGVERRIVEVARRLDNEIKTTVYSGTKAGFKKPVSMNNLTVLPCFSTDILFPVDNWIFNKSISKAMSRIGADLYEAHTVSAYEFLRKMRKNRSGFKPFIQTIHGVLADEYMQSQRNRSSNFRSKMANLIMWHLSRLEKESAKNASFVVTVSKYSMTKLVKLYNVEKTKIRIVPNGVDPQNFKPLQGLDTFKRRIGIYGKHCVLFVGRLIPRKGLHFLVEASKRIIREHNKTVFLIVGDGPLRNQMRSQLERDNISRNYVFLGDVKEKSLPLLYNCADVFALPSIQEGQGIALLEAQATAKPVVAFNIGGVQEAVINNQTGLLVKPNSQDLADAILKLLSDSSLRERMGKEGREFVSNSFTWDISAQKMLKVYNEAFSFAN